MAVHSLHGAEMWLYFIVFLCMLWNAFSDVYRLSLSKFQQFDQYVFINYYIKNKLFQKNCSLPYIGKKAANNIFLIYWQL